MANNIQKLNIKALALSMGILASAYIFLLGMAASIGWGKALVAGIGSMYIGYGATFVGALIGAVYAFIDGAIAGAVIAWLYNKFVPDK